MAFSGTVSQTVFDTRRVIENAARRCRVPPQTLTAEHIEVANDQLYLLLSDLANRGIPLWCIEKRILPLYAGTALMALDTSTVDILNSNLRQLQQVTGTETSPSAAIEQVEFDTDQTVGSVGIKWSGASTAVALERSDDGLSWVTVSEEAPVALAGEWTWYDLPSAVAALFFRVRATTGTLAIDELYLGNTPTEIPLARLNRDDYTNLPNKQFQSNRPLQFWFDRRIPQPVMNLWPVPNAGAETSQLVVWVQRYIMDVGTMTQQVEVPQRWYEAVVAMLAAKLAMEYLEVDPAIIPMLDQKAAQALFVAQQEERDNSPINILPNIGMYTK
jgi:hypothetical protein